MEGFIDDSAKFSKNRVRTFCPVFFNKFCESPDYISVIVFSFLGIVMIRLKFFKYNLYRKIHKWSKNSKM